MYFDIARGLCFSVAVKVCHSFGGEMVSINESLAISEKRLEAFGASFRTARFKAYSLSGQGCLGK
jgi:hypothetical protein